MSYKFNHICITYYGNYEGYPNPRFIISDLGQVTFFDDAESPDPKHGMFFTLSSDTFWLFEMANTYLEHPVLTATGEEAQRMEVKVIGHENHENYFGGSDGLTIINVPTHLFFHNGSLLGDHVAPYQDAVKYPYGSMIIGTIFGVHIPMNYAPGALSVLHECIMASPDPSLREEGKNFIATLIEREDWQGPAPRLSDRLREYLDSKKETFVKNWRKYHYTRDEIESIIDGAYTLLNVGKRKEAEALVDRLIDRKVAKGHLMKASIYCEAINDKLDQYLKGAELGDPECMVEAAEVYLSKDRPQKAYKLIQKACKMGVDEAYSLLADAVYYYNCETKCGEDNPFHSQNPLHAALKIAMTAAMRGDNHGKRLAGQLIPKVKVEYNELARQWLEQAVADDYDDALPVLAEFYTFDRPNSCPRDLVKAETLIKQAILKESGEFDRLQALYAVILVEQGRKEEADTLIKELRDGGKKTVGA